MLASRSNGAAMVQNFFKGPKAQHIENGPLSIINIFAKRTVPQPEPQQMVPEREKTRSPTRQRSTSKKSPQKQQASPKKKAKQSKPKSKKQASFDDIEEDIIPDSYTEIESDQITESIASFRG